MHIIKNENIEEENFIKSIASLAKKTYDDILEQGIDGIINLFSTQDTLTNKLSYNPEIEYLKRMLLAQMDLNGMLLTHKYFNTSFDEIPKFRKESEQLKAYTETESSLTFDEKTISSLFGNSLKIESEEEYNEWKEFAYDDRHKEKRFYDIYFEEEFKYNYENDTNKIKKFIKSFKYKKILKTHTLEDSYMKKVRLMLKENIEANPDNTFIAYQKVNEILDKGVVEYESLKELEGIIKMTLISLQQEQDKPINIESVCETLRTENEESNLPKMETKYREKEVTLGSETGIKKGPIIRTIPFEEVPNAIKDLQKEYEDIYLSSKTQEDYIRGVSKIYVDFIYIQPYQDGNKRTALCMLNSMLLSKGIIPPPISLINDQQIIEGYNKAKDKNYDMLQDAIVHKHEKLQLDLTEKNEDDILKENIVKDKTELIL